MRLLAGRALRLSVALAGMLTAAGAFAHAHLQQQIPTAGAQLSASPQTLTLSFSEGIEPAFSGVTVTGPQQHAVATGKLTRSADTFGGSLAAGRVHRGMACGLGGWS